MSCSRRCQLWEASSEMELSSFWEPSHVALDCDLAVPAPAHDAAAAAVAALAAAVAVLAAALGQLAAANPLADDLLPMTRHAAFAVQAC